MEAEPAPEPQTAALLARMARDFADAPAAPTIEQRRAALRTMADLYGPAPAPVARVEDHRAPGAAGEIPLRVYWPREVSARAPVILHLHGGGWTVGDPESYARVCRAYCAAAGAIVVDVHYRRAPEHPYPAALEDAEAALGWAAANAERLGGDPARLVVTGDSAGGALAAAACHRADIPLALQVLVYPMLSAQAGAPFPSRARLGHGRFFLSHAAILQAEAEYLGDPRRGEDPAASPVLAGDEALRRAPPSLIITAGLDPLRDEAEAHARRLSGLGAPVEQICFAGTIHGFVLFAGAIEAGARAITLIGQRIRALAPR